MRRERKGSLSESLRRLSLILVGMFAYAADAMAQNGGSAGISAATTMMTSYFDPATKLVYAIAAVLGLIGGIRVYSKFSSGDPDTSKTAAGWFGGCVALVICVTILRAFFL